MQDSLAKLLISDLRIWVRLGCSAQEKYNLQLVSFNIELTFNSPPDGIRTDQLEDTVCYYETVKCIQNLCQHKEFNLIEHLTADVHKTIDHALGEKREWIAKITVTMCKMHPPVPGIHGGVSFTYCNAPTRGKQ